VPDERMVQNTERSEGSYGPNANRTRLSRINREKSPRVEEPRLADWSSKLCPRLCPNGCLLSTNTVNYGETGGNTFPELSR
jgi:hypothetical protein